MNTPTSLNEGVVIGVNGNVVTVNAAEGSIIKNEVAYVCTGDQKLKSEVLRIQGRTADLQVFEETDGVEVGDRVEFTTQMLSVDLGPGLLGNIYDGLQNPLKVLAEKDGFFLKRGRYVEALDQKTKWAFNPTKKVGDKLVAGDVIGTVKELHYTHKIMIPFAELGEVELTWIQGGNCTVDEPVAKIRDAMGRERSLTMTQSWPVRRPIPSSMLSRRLIERRYPSEPLITSTRLIDTFFPIAMGGTACIPVRSVPVRPFCKA